MTHMPPYTRRRALAAGGTALLPLAGCLAREESPQGTVTTSVQDGTTTTGGTNTADPEQIEWSRDIPVTTDLTVADGTIVVGDREGVLHVLGADGSEQWTYEADSAIRSVQVTEDTLYLTTGERSGAHISGAQVHAVERGGQQRWATGVGKRARQAHILGVADGVLGVGLQNDNIKPTGEATFGLDIRDGSEVWRHETGDVDGGNAGPERIYALEYESVVAFHAGSGARLWSRPVEFPDSPFRLGSVLVVPGKTIAGLDPSNGHAAWTFGGSLDLHGAIRVGDRVYTRGEVIAALERDGTETWRYDRGGWLGAHRSGLLFGADDSRCYALRTDGNEQWTASIPADYFDLEAATETLVAGTAEETVHAYDQADGTRAYSAEFPEGHSIGLAATRDRFVMATESGLYALRG